MITSAYDHFGVQILSYKRMEVFRTLYYERAALRKSVNAYSKQFLGEIIYKGYKGRKGLNRNDLLAVLDEYDLDRIEDILNNLPTNDRTRVTVSDEQRQQIETWCLSNQQRALDKIGEVLNHDFSAEFPDVFEASTLVNIQVKGINSEINELESVTYWRNKYIDLLEKHNNFLGQ